MDSTTSLARVHKTLCVTPGIAAKVTDRVMDMADLVALIDAAAPPPKVRGPYKPREKAA